MINKRAFFIFAAVFLINFSLTDKSFAIESVDLSNNATYKYPDYAYEFVGKDKCENFNRKIFIFNSKVNKFVIRPINTVWASVMPQYGMDRVKSACNNIEYPVRLVSCLLQKDFKSSKQETVRFFTNTTLGLGGLYDPAKDKFKIEPRQEDMGQALAKCKKIKSGPYVVLPIVASGSVRDIAGQALDYALTPTSYVIGPVVMMAKALTTLNKTTYLQSIVKTIDNTYVDPYEITKKLTGAERYLRTENLDRGEVLAEKTASQNIVKINDTEENSVLKPALRSDLKCDIELNNFNSQCPLVDSLRTVMFEGKNMNDSVWSEMSVWNKSFSNKLKIASVSVDDKRPNYKYQYILQKNKNAPLAIIYPSFGEGIRSHHSIVLAKLFYDEGYSVVIQGSVFQWEFVKSMPSDYRPGFPKMDTHYLRLITSKILANLETKKACNPSKKILIGTSFGALDTLFVAAKEEEENILGISKYISVNPPVEIFYALTQVDKYSQDWKNDPSDIKMRATVTVAKAIQVAQNISQEKDTKKVSRVLNKGENKVEDTNIADIKDPTLPFTDGEAKLIIGFVMKQKLSDLVFTMENVSKSKKSDFYQKINNMSFYDYATKYLHINNYGSIEQLNNDTSLYPLADFFQKNEKYKIYHTVDDYYATPEQLAWLKRQAKDKAVFFSNGSHLGCLYRKEFTEELKKDIQLQPMAQTSVQENGLQLEPVPEEGSESTPLLIKPGL